jgi:ADP-heptose:LPS heptosyltransferase
MALAAAPEKILVIKLSALGDFIQALGPMAAIRRHHPNAYITLLTTKPYASFGEKCGYFDAVHCDARPKIFDIAGWLKLRRLLQGGHYTRVYDLQNNDRTNFYLHLFPRGKKPEWVGAAMGASHRNTSAARVAGHALEGHIQTLGLAGIKDIEIDDLRWIKEDVSSFDLKKPFILLVAGSAPQHPYKRWPAEYYATLASRLSDQGFQPVLLGTQAEADVTTRVKTLCPRALDLTGQTTLFQIGALARDAAGAIGNDTGPMHMIAPTGCPCLTLFSGHSNPKRHTPRGAHVKVLQKEKLDHLPVDDVLKTLEIMLIARR